MAGLVAMNDNTRRQSLGAMARYSAIDEKARMEADRRKQAEQQHTEQMAMSGAMAGAMVGGTVGGPVGAVVGLVIGGIAGSLF